MEANDFLVTWAELERICPRLASPRALANVLDNCVVAPGGDANAPACVHVKTVVRGNGGDGEHDDAHMYAPACQFHV